MDEEEREEEEEEEVEEREGMAGRELKVCSWSSVGRVEVSRWGRGVQGGQPGATEQDFTRGGLLSSP